jgi:hypothetical protein
MTQTLSPPGVRPRDERSDAQTPELLEWLRSGRLTLLDSDRVPVDAEQWSDLSAETRRHALAEFDRVVRGNAKAAVLFLK